MLNRNVTKLTAHALWVMVVSLIFCSQAYSEQSSQNTITVIGKGTVIVVPDAFAITVSLEEKGPTVTKLNQAMQARVQSIVQFLISEGIDEQHIQSININLYPDYQSTPQGRRQVGVVLSRQIKVQSQNLAHYDKVMDGLLSRGVERIEQFNFINTAEDKAYETALIAAVNDAREKAELMAKQLGQRIIGVKSVVQAGNAMAPRMRSQQMMMESSSSSLPGKMDIDTQVNATFVITPAK